MTPGRDRYEGVAYATVREFNEGERPGWVKLDEDTPAYRVGARWYVRVLSDAGVGRLNEGTHTVTEHEDGTITVEPSLVMANGWHGWLRGGVFEVLEWDRTPLPSEAVER